jgi:uncharacterized protein YcfJ
MERFMQQKKISIRSNVRMIALIMLLVFPIAFLSACGAKLGKQITKVNYYPKCYEPVATLRKNASDMTRNVAGGAVLGAIGGAIIGYQATGDAGGAAVGAVAGAAIGAGLSYLITSEVQNKSTAERFKTYNQTIKAEIAKVDLGIQGARIALQCYTNEYKTLNSQYQKNAVSKPEMTARLTEIRDGATEAQTILHNYKDQITTNKKQFEDIVKVETQRPQGRASNNQITQLRRETQRSIDKSEKEYSAVDNGYTELVKIANAQLTTSISKLELTFIADNSATSSDSMSCSAY